MEKSAKQQKFEEERKDMTDREIQMEILYSKWLIQDRTERTRANTATIVWVIALTVILNLIFAIPQFVLTVF